MVPEYKRVQSLAPDTLEDVSDMTIDIFNHVFDLRKQRCEMVQSFPQYEFLHKCIVAYAREVEDLWEKENLGSESNLDVSSKDADSVRTTSTYHSYDKIDVDIP